jgi:peptidoglycan/LPS O-acetylase OafA/YrhL
MSSSSELMTPPRVPAIDGLRAIAALSVVVVHCWTLAGSPVTGVRGVPLYASAYLGVDMFFVISGFLLFLPWASGHPLPLRNYISRRAARLLPAYYVSVLVVLVVWPFTVHQPGFDSVFPLSTFVGWLAIASHLTMLQGIALPARGHSPGLGVNPVWWTLTVEAIFYISLPWAARVFRRHPVAACLGTVSVSVAWRYLLFCQPALMLRLLGHARPVAFILSDGVVGFAGHFALGMAAALLFVRRPRLSSRGLVAALVAATALAVGVQWILGRDVVAKAGVFDSGTVAYALGRTIFGLAVAVAIVSLAHLAIAQVILGRGVLKWIGDRSYGVYLFHFVIAQVLYHETHLFSRAPHRASTFLLGLAVVTPLALAAGWASYEFVERPIIRWARHREPRGEPHVSVQVALTPAD